MLRCSRPCLLSTKYIFQLRFLKELLSCPGILIISIRLIQRFQRPS
jgi:hypothetical protein